MKGLLLKDWKLIRSQKTFVIIIAIIACYSILAGNIQFGMTYAAIIFSMLVISTVNFDDQDNGMGFIFTFPISRKTYVLEKYVLGWLSMAAVLITGSLLAAFIMAAGRASYEPQEWFSAGLGYLLTSSVLLSATLPLQIRFGAEKGRLVLATVFICIGVAAYVVLQSLKEFEVDISSITDLFSHAGVKETAIGCVVLIVVMFGISILVSMSAMKRRQF